MLKHVIFHLNVLADPALLCAHYQTGLADIMQRRYGKSRQFWINIQAQIFADWASYHADLNYSADEGMNDILEGRFRVTRALFRLAQIPEPPKQEITQVAEYLISQAPKYGDALFHDSHDLLSWLLDKNISIAIVSYYPEIQLRAILCGAQLEEKISYLIGSDSFEQFEMDNRYFEYLLNKLKSRASECLYVDNQTTVIEIATRLQMKTLQLERSMKPCSWLNQLQNCFG